MAEMLVVLVIAAIAAAMAVPRLRGVTRVASVQGALNRVANDIAYTRIRAIRNGQRAQLLIAADGKSYTVTIDPNGGNNAKLDKTVKLSLDYPDLTLAPTSGKISFDSRGILVTPGSATAVSATRQGRTDSVTISLVGRVYREF